MRAAPYLSEGAARIRLGLFPIPQTPDALEAKRKQQQCARDHRRGLGNGRQIYAQVHSDIVGFCLVPPCLKRQHVTSLYW